MTPKVDFENKRENSGEKFDSNEANDVEQNLAYIEFQKCLENSGQPLSSQDVRRLLRLTFQGRDLRYKTNSEKWEDW